MKKVLLLGAFAALFIACDKNDSSLEVMDELATSGITAEVIENEIQTVSLFENLKTPEAIDAFISSKEGNTEASRSNGISFEEGFSNWKALWADQIASRPTHWQGPREGTGSFASINAKYGYLRNIDKQVWLRLVLQGIAENNSDNVDILTGTDDFGRFMKFTSAIDPRPSVYGRGRNRNEVSTKAFSNRNGGVYNREVMDVITFEMPTENFHQAMVFQNKLKGGPNGWFTSLDHTGTVKMRIRGLSAQDLDYPGRLIPGNVYTFYFLAKVTAGHDGYATFVIYDNTNREIIHSVFRRNVRTTSPKGRIQYMALRNGMYCGARRINEIKIYKLAQYVSPVRVPLPPVVYDGLINISASTTSPNRCDTVDFTIDTSEVVGDFTKVTIQHKNSVRNVWSNQIVLSGANDVYTYSKPFGCSNTAPEFKVRVTAQNSNEVVDSSELTLNIQ